MNPSEDRDFSLCDNVLHIATVLEEGISGKGYDQSLDLREFDTPERLELSGLVVVSLPHFPIPSVRRFGRDLRHLTKKGEIGPSHYSGRCSPSATESGSVHSGQRAAGLGRHEK